MNLKNEWKTKGHYYTSSVNSGRFQSATSESNWCFVDEQNLYKGVKQNGWKINWTSFRQYLSKNYNVTKAVIFMGYIKEYEYLYRIMRAAGFILEFRQVRIMPDGKVDGGNVDADLASYVMDYKTEYSKAIIVADDSDYLRTITSLNRQNKLRLIISSHSIKNTSQYIKQAVDRNMIISIHAIKNIIAYGTTQ